MDVEPHVATLRGELERLAAIGDPATAEAAHRMAVAADAPLRLLLFEVLSQAAAELSTELPGGRAELRLAGGDAALAYLPDLPSAAPALDEPPGARVSLRLPETLKADAERAAAREGVSLNTWLVRAIARGLSHSTSPGAGRRLTGFGRA